MNRIRIGSTIRRTVVGAALTIWCLTGVSVYAQNNTNNVITQQIAGVFVDADGVLRMKLFGEKGGALSQKRKAEGRANLAADIAKSSKLRKVSLNRLEAAIEKLARDGKTPTDDMLHLAGLLRVQYVFLYPETNDLVVAGPAEGWAADLSGRVLGLDSGRPVLLLEDLVTALRAYPASGKGRDSDRITCSIDATKEGLANMQQYFASVASTATPARAQMIARGMKDALGLQTVTIRGVSPKTHFARVLVEADYRMKMIGIGLEQTSVNIQSYPKLANSSSFGSNAMQRWWFVPDYECVKVAEDELAMEIVGQGVKLVGADELVNADGSRSKSNNVDTAGKKFVEGFTKKFPELAAAAPVYAELRNLIDLAVVAAFVQKYDYYNRINWQMATFGSEQAFPVEGETAPMRVESAVNAVNRGGRLMFPIGGGVRLEAKLALESPNLLKDEDGEVRNARQSIQLNELREGQWWWD